MEFEEVHSLFERCMDLADRAPPEHRETILGIARDLLALARQCISALPDGQEKTGSSRAHRLCHRMEDGDWSQTKPKMLEPKGVEGLSGSKHNEADAA